MLRHRDVWGHVILHPFEDLSMVTLVDDYLELLGFS